MGQPASLARRISADTTWGQRDFYGDDNLDDDDFDDLDGDDDDDVDDLDDDGDDDGDVDVVVRDGDDGQDCWVWCASDTTWGRRDFYEES